MRQACPALFTATVNNFTVYTHAKDVDSNLPTISTYSAMYRKISMTKAISAVTRSGASLGTFLLRKHFVNCSRPSTKAEFRDLCCDDLLVSDSQMA